MPKPKKPYIHLSYKKRSYSKENTIIQHHNTMNVLLGNQIMRKLQKVAKKIAGKKGPAGKIGKLIKPP